MEELSIIHASLSFQWIHKLDRSSSLRTLTFFEELKETKFNRDECLQHFPGCFHFEGISERRSRVETLDSPENYSRGNFLENDDPTFNKKSYLFNITEEVTIEEEPNVFPEFSIVFLIV